MGNKFEDATQHVQDWTELYRQLDALPNRHQWHFAQNYLDHDTCGFVFAHANPGSEESYNSISMLSKTLYNAGIRNSLIARNHILSDVIIAPEYAELARKLFAKYEPSQKDETKTNDALFGHFNGYQK